MRHTYTHSPRLQRSGYSGSAEPSPVSPRLPTHTKGSVPQLHTVQLSPALRGGARVQQPGHTAPAGAHTLLRHSPVLTRNRCYTLNSKYPLLPWPHSDRGHLSSLLPILKCFLFSRKGPTPSRGRPSVRGKAPSVLRKRSTVSRLAALGRCGSESLAKSSDFLECLFFFFFFFLCLWRSASEHATERSESC